LSDDDVRSLYQMADALFFPSRQEGYGLPLIEAALHGVPVFCSDIPAHREVAVGATFFKLDRSAEGHRCANS
jgi:glycosyltransferase involved in cell wall biosynthesis